MRIVPKMQSFDKLQRPADHPDVESSETGLRCYGGDRARPPGVGLRTSQSLDKDRRAAALNEGEAFPFTCFSKDCLNRKYRKTVLSFLVSVWFFVVRMLFLSNLDKSFSLACPPLSLQIQKCY